MARKYHKGTAIQTVEQLARAIEVGEYVFYRHKPLHPLFIRNMNFNTVLGGIRAGCFIRAKEYTGKKED